MMTSSPEFSRRSWRSPLAELLVVTLIATVFATAIVYVLVP
jgi:hypothetical protein